MTTGHSPAPADAGPNEIFAVDLARLAREVAMDIFPIDSILRLHELTDEQWARIQEQPKFRQMLTDMITEWNSAASTLDRVRIKAATGLEAMLEEYILAIKDHTIPLNHRTEAGKFLAKLGELDGTKIGGGAAGPGFSININIGQDKQVSLQGAIQAIEHEAAE